MAYLSKPELLGEVTTGDGTRVRFVQGFNGRSQGFYVEYLSSHDRMGAEIWQPFTADERATTVIRAPANQVKVERMKNGE